MFLKNKIIKCCDTKLNMIKRTWDTKDKIEQLNIK